jgi:hypothetical protein
MRKPRCLMFYPWNLNDRSGALTLLLSYSRALKAAGYRIDCFASGGSLDDDTFDNVFGPPNGSSPLTQSLEVLGGLYEDALLPEKFGKDEASMVAAGVLASISDYDIIGIHYTRCNSLKQMLPPGVPVVMFTHDIDSLVGQQEQMLFGIASDYHLDDEVARLKPFELVTAVGPDDRRILHSVAPALPVVEAPFTCGAATTVTIREDSPGVLLWLSSTASFHRMSFSWFWQKVWPTVRAARPECRLVIAGRIAEFARELGAGADPQVSLRGVVSDTEELYRDADVMVAPYYFGLGIKIKVIEALSKGLPVATTTLGIFNTRIEPGRDAVVSDDASEYSDHVIQLISCPDLRATLAHNGLAYIRKWHDPRQALATFVQAFDHLRLSGKTASRSRAGAVRGLAEPLKSLVPWTIQRCREDGAKKIALYGAGSHTRLLLPMWAGLRGPAVHQIIVSETPNESRLLGIPIVAADEFDSTQVDAIVLSSYAFEEEMASICRSRWPGAKVYSIWRPLQRGSAAACDNLCDRIPAALYEIYENTSPLLV